MSNSSVSILLERNCTITLSLMQTALIRSSTVTRFRKFVATPPMIMAYNSSLLKTTRKLREFDWTRSSAIWRAQKQIQTDPLADVGPDRKVTISNAACFTFESCEPHLKLQQGGAGEFQCVFLRLETGADRVVEIGCNGLFNVRTEDMRNWLAIEEFYEASDRFLIVCPVADVKPTRVKSIAAENKAGPRVIVRHVDCVVARDGQGIQRAAAEIQLARSVWPIGDVEGLLNGIDVGCDQLSSGTVFELGVASGVVAVAV